MKEVFCTWSAKKTNAAQQYKTYAFFITFSFKVDANTIVTFHLKRIFVENLLWNGDKCSAKLDYCPKLLELCLKEFPPLPASFSSCLYHKLTKSSNLSEIDFELTRTDIEQSITLNISSYTVSNRTFYQFNSIVPKKEPWGIDNFVLNCFSRDISQEMGLTTRWIFLIVDRSDSQKWGSSKCAW